MQVKNQFFERIHAINNIKNIRVFNSWWGNKLVNVNWLLWCSGSTYDFENGQSIKAYHKT